MPIDLWIDECGTGEWKAYGYIKNDKLIILKSLLKYVKIVPKWVPLLRAKLLFVF